MAQSAIVSAVQSASLSQWLVAGLLVVIAHCAYNLLLHPLSKFPGPLSARLGIPGLWAFMAAHKRQYSWRLEDLHDRHGPIVRISANHVSISTPEAASIIYAHGTGTTFPKSRFYESFMVYPKRPSLFSEINPEKHAAFRRAISAAYSMNSLVKLEEYIEPLLDRYVKRLEKAGKEARGGVIDMSKWMHFLAMDSVGELAFGEAFGFVERGNDPYDFLQGVSNLSRWGSMAGWIPDVSFTARKILKRWSGQPGGETVGVLTKPLIDRRFEILAAKKSGKQQSKDQAEADALLADRRDMLASFIESKNPTTGQPLSQLEVLRTAISIVAAGSDTTSTTLVAFVGYLVRHPDVYKKLQAEIDEAFDTGALTSPVQYNAAVKLDYLQACIKETLRFHPPIPMSLPRIVAQSQGLVLREGLQRQSYNASGAGVVIPAGVQVSVAPYVLHRSEAAYGKDARTYNPQRWLDVDEKARKDLERNNLAFGGGNRQCIGKNISLMEINKVLPTLLRYFTFSIPSDARPTAHCDSDGRVAKDVPWRCEATWFLEVSSFPLLVSRRTDIDM